MISDDTTHLQQALPALPWYFPGTEDYQKRRPTYCSTTAVPRAILCPRDANEVAAVVRLARKHQIPFSVRTGGHDVHGRSMVDGALCIDMRNINFVEIAQDRKTAVLGGGTQLGKLTTDLHSHGLITPTGSVPSIGYVGWATLGGYGCLSTHFGLGVDQILEAEVVNDKGQIVNADEAMLRGIKGAGGNFGIVTSIRIKVYEVDTLLAGILMLDTSATGISQTFKDVMLSLQEYDRTGGLSPNVVLQPLVLNHPQAGRGFGISYVWSTNDHEEGQAELDKLIARIPATVAMNTVSAVAPPAWVEVIGSFIAKSVWGGPHAISFGSLSERTLDIIGEGLEVMPSDPGTCFSLHMLSRQSPSVTDLASEKASCFNPLARQAHTVLEIIGSSLSEEAMESCGQWAKSLREKLFASGEAMKGTYVSLIGPESTKLSDVYGEKLELLTTLKQKFDPDGIFKYAVPRMSG